MSTDQRRFKRLPVKLALEVSNLFKQDNKVIKNVDTEIEVFDISKNGIGFMSVAEFPLDYYFNATIEFESSEGRITTVVKIIHREAIGDSGFRYGCQFVGLAGIFDYLFDEYEESLEEELS